MSRIEQAADGHCGGARATRLEGDGTPERGIRLPASGTTSRTFTELPRDRMFVTSEPDGANKEPPARIPFEAAPGRACPGSSAARDELRPANCDVLFSGKRFSGFLFDMDGTILTSIEASQRVWTGWAARFGLDAADFLPQSHGMRVVEVIERLGIPNVDAAREAELILRAELADMDGVTEVRGAAAFLSGLPQDRWAVVTSAPRALALRRLAAARLPEPPVLISAEHVERGKPDPAGYRLGAGRLGVPPEECIIFEDAPAGVQAGKAAGAAVILIKAAHPASALTDCEAVQDYTQLTAAFHGRSAALWVRRAC